MRAGSESEVGPEARELLAVLAGGTVGTLARAGLAELVEHDPGHWPWATLAANLVAATLLGHLVVRLPAGDLRRPLLGAGLCGGLSTFSTVQLELLDMLDVDALALALAYAVTTIATGLMAAAIAARFTRRALVDR